VLRLRTKADFRKSAAVRAQLIAAFDLTNLHTDLIRDHLRATVAATKPAASASFADSLTQFCVDGERLAFAKDLGTDGRPWRIWGATSLALGDLADAAGQMDLSRQGFVLGLDSPWSSRGVVGFAVGLSQAHHSVDDAGYDARMSQTALSAYGSSRLNEAWNLELTGGYAHLGQDLRRIGADSLAVVGERPGHVLFCNLGLMGEIHADDLTVRPYVTAQLSQVTLDASSESGPSTDLLSYARERAYQNSLSAGLDLAWLAVGPGLKPTAHIAYRKAIDRGLSQGVASINAPTSALSDIFAGPLPEDTLELGAGAEWQALEGRWTLNYRLSLGTGSYRVHSLNLAYGTTW